MFYSAVSFTLPENISCISILFLMASYYYVVYILTYLIPPLLSTANAIFRSFLLWKLLHINLLQKYLPLVYLWRIVRIEIRGLKMCTTEILLNTAKLPYSSFESICQPYGNNISLFVFIIFCIVEVRNMIICC